MLKGPQLIVTVVVAIIAVIAVIAGGVAASRSTPQYDRDRPEGVVQAYLEAMIDGDHSQAEQSLADSSPCEIEDLEQSYVSEGVRVILRDAQVDGDRATVRVSIADSAGGAFAGSEQFSERTFRLAREGQTWRIQGAPWPTYECGNRF